MEMYQIAYTFGRCLKLLINISEHHLVARFAPLPGDNVLPPSHRCRKRNEVPQRIESSLIDACPNFFGNGGEETVDRVNGGSSTYPLI